MPAKATLAMCAVLIFTFAAWNPTPGSTTHYLVYSVLALTAYGLKVSGRTNMGFLFVILALRELNLADSLLMAASALLIHAVRTRTTVAIEVLESLFTAGMSVMLANLIWSADFWSAHPADLSIRLMLAAGGCFVAEQALSVRKGDLWALPYYLVGAAIASLIPVSALMVPLLYLTYRSYKLYVERLDQERELSRKQTSLHLRTIEALTMAIEAREQPATGSRRVAVFCEQLGRGLGLPDTELEALRAAAMLHDIGELAVPDHIIGKPGPLTAEEFERVKVHANIGAEILERVRFPFPVAEIVRAHHERWDGTGYPNGLRGIAIPAGARILAVVDTVNALASPRSHRPAVSLDEAVKTVAAEAGKAFDPKVVGVLRKHYQQWERLAAAHPSSAPEAPRREKEALAQLSGRLRTRIDLEEIFSLVKPALRSLVPFDTMIVFVERAGTVLPLYVGGDHMSLCRSLQIPRGSGISGRVAATRQPVVNGDPAEEVAHLGWSGLGSLWTTLSVPLVGPRDLVGALTVYRSDGAEFDTEDARILSAVAPKLAFAVENGLRFQQSAQTADDPLTGLPTAGALVERLAGLREPAALVVIDIDRFRGINIRHGCDVGDRLLREIGARIAAQCGPDEFAARVGGDEFAIVLPGVGPEDIDARLTSIGETIRGALDLPGEPVEINFGVAYWPTDGGVPAELLAEADRRMYISKVERRTNEAGAQHVSVG